MLITTQKALKNLLKNGYPNHSVFIQSSSSSLKDAHIYSKINNVSGQVAGAQIEKYIRNNWNMEKNNPSYCIGDVNKNGIDYEIKVSNGGKNHNKFNYVQIRLNHECEYIFTAFII